MKMILASVLASTCIGTAASAHHSWNAVFDPAQEVEMTGVVSRLAFRNPHVRIYFMVTGEDGAQEEWMAEGGSYSSLERTGWGGGDIRPGDVVTIHGHASRAGLNAIHMQSVTLSNGREIDAEEPTPEGGIEAVRARRRTEPE